MGAPAVLPLILRRQLSLALYSIPGWLLHRYVFPCLGSFGVEYVSSLFFLSGSSSANAYSWHVANSNQYTMKRLARASLKTCTSLQACAFNQQAADADTFFLGFSDAHIIGERGGVNV